ncbi:MAG: NAD-dependent epimerase/dehydratase family protein [Candidatus Krumholzibacteriia bacterium]
MRKSVTLITGASGEVGHAIIEALAHCPRAIITLDPRPLATTLANLVEREFVGSVLDHDLLEQIAAEHEVDTVFHLAALLSTRSETMPVAAHQVNVDGTLNLLEFARTQGEAHDRPVVFLYPSSIAVYGLPDLATKVRAGAVKEREWNLPRTMYGCNKLCCEHLGRYYGLHYAQLAPERPVSRVDFRAIRLPGLISAETLPSGGTSDFAPEMIHAAARGEPYRSFVRPDSRIPFMLMADAVDAMLALAGADRACLRQSVYNVGAFNPSASEVRDLVLEGFPEADIGFAPEENRQAIVDSWPADVDMSAANEDWGLAARQDAQAAFREVLIPSIRKRYTDWPGPGDR